MTGRDLTRAGAVVAAWLATCGCRQIFGVSDYRLEPVATSEAGAPYVGYGEVAYVSEACRDCVDRSCKAAVLACASEPACQAMNGCLARCGVDDHECRGRCNLSIPETAEFGALTACSASNGCDACSASRAVLGGAGCDQCLASTCPEAVAAASKTSPSASADGGACGAVKCAPDSLSCACDPDGEGAPLTNPLSSCAAGGCHDPCNPLVDWSCLGSVQSPLAARPQDGLLLHVEFDDPTNFIRPLCVGPDCTLHVAACAGLDPDCTGENVLGSGDTDPASATGLVTLKIMPPNTAMGGPFFNRLFVTSSSLGYDGALIYFFPPLRTNTVWVRRRLVSRSLADTLTSNLTVDWKTKGGIVWSSTSCVDLTAPGIRVAFQSGSAQPMYYLGANGSKTTDQTGPTGIGFAVNIDPGPITLAATVADTGALIGTYDVRVAAGSITHLIVTPVPR